MIETFLLIQRQRHMYKNNHKFNLKYYIKIVKVKLYCQAYLRT